MRMALWQRERDGYPVRRPEADGEGLIHHFDAGSQGRLNRWSQHPVITEVLDGQTSAARGSGFAVRDATTGAPDAGAGTIATSAFYPATVRVRTTIEAPR